MPEIGSYFTTRTGGWAARWIRLLTRSTVNHAGVLVSVDPPVAVEAELHGARLTDPFTSYPDAVWSRVPAGKGDAIATAAQHLVGTPYNVLDIAALAVAEITGRRTPRFIARRLNRPDRLICSQLVDYAYNLAGVQLFTDNRLSSDVTPADLYDLEVADEPVVLAGAH